MFTVISALYDLLTQMGPFVIALLILRRKKGKYSTPSTQWHLLALLVFALYLFAVFQVTGAGTIYEAIRAKDVAAVHRIQFVNLIPFSRDISLAGYVLNIVMCIPFGFLVPLIWEDMGRLSRVVPAGFLFSLLIELSQLLSIRGTDVDDLIMNTLGTMAGFILYLAFDKVTLSKLQLHDEDARELPIYILVMYLGRCLLLNHLGLIQLWYGY